MRPPDLQRRESPRGAGSSVDTELQASPKYTAPAGRCVHCLDPTRRGWTVCDKCHAWSDLWHGLHPAGLGVDQARLDRARSYFAGRRPRESMEQLLHRLMRRMATVENTMSWRAIEVAGFDPDWQTR